MKNPSDVLEILAKSANAKSQSGLGKVTLLSFLAGAYISFGCLLAIVATSGMADAGVPLGVEKFIFGAMFPLGLILVVFAGAELFTGNVMVMTIGVLKKTSRLKDLLINWTLSWIFNFAGALFIAFVIAYLGGVMPTDSSAPAYVITSKAVSVAEAKISMPFSVALIKGIGCNWLVCLAIWVSTTVKEPIAKMFGIWFPVMAFVTLGFEHCIANMLFIPLAALLGSTSINLGNFLIGNLLPVTIGNIIGGAVFVACIYFVSYAKD